MTSTEIYLELLRAGLWNRPAVVSGSAKFAELVELARHQNTLPTVSKAVLDKFADRLPRKTHDFLQDVVQKCEKSHQAANSVIAYATQELAAEDISSVLLKGQGIASHYPVPTIRQAGDIDLYVKDFSRARAVMARLFGPETEVGSKHVTYHVGGTLDIELHKYTEVLAKESQNAEYQLISDKGTSEYLELVRLDGHFVNTPESTFNAFYIFHHLWHHFTGMGIGMRQLCDWAMFLHSHKGKLDEARLGEWLETFGLKDAWQVFGCAAVQALALPPEDLPFYDASKAKRGSRLVDFFLVQGDNRAFKHGRHDQSKLRHKGGSLRFIHRRLKLMFPIFPGKALLQYVGDIKNGLLKLFKAGTPDLGLE